jgi:hypothetical protein
MGLRLYTLHTGSTGRHSTTLDNPVYDGGSPGRRSAPENERDMDNPIYGLQDERTYGMFEDTTQGDVSYDASDHSDNTYSSIGSFSES